MPKTAKQKPKALDYVGANTFDPTPDAASAVGTNEEELQAFANELPWIRFAFHMMTESDVDLEAKVRGMDQAAVRSMMDLVDGMRGVMKRHKALVDVLASSQARVLIVLDRCHNGPRKAAWAGTTTRRPAKAKGREVPRG